MCDESRTFKDFVKKDFLKDVANVLWHVVDGVQSIDDALSLWEKLFCEIAEEHAPTKLRRVKGQKTP